MIALLIWLAGAVGLSYGMWRYGLFAIMGHAILILAWLAWVFGGAAAMSYRLRGKQTRGPSAADLKAAAAAQHERILAAQRQDEGGQ